LLHNDPTFSKGGLNLGIRLIGIILLIGAVVLVRDILLLSFIAVLLAVLMSFPVRLLSKILPRGLSVVFTLILLLGGFGALGFANAPNVSEQFQSVLQRLPEAIDQAENWYSKLRKHSAVHQIPPSSQIADRLSKRVGPIFENSLKGIIPAAKGLIESVTSLMYLLILALFLVYQPRSYLNGVRTLVPKEKEGELNEAYRRLSQGLQHWLGGILISMTLMGVFTAIGLAVAGIDSWLILSIFTFLGTFVPYLGAIASSIPGLLTGLSQSPQHFFYTCLVYLGVHILEGYVVQPLIMRRAIELRPAFLLLGQAILGSLFGILGIIVAAPLLACIQILVQFFYAERTLGRKNQTQKQSKAA
jgi:predicted PurR-regulated permease PerM